jgi:6-phosphogluconate dehydrogenase
MQPRYDLAVIGLGVMGRNLLCNMADHGFRVAGMDKDPKQVDALRKEAEHIPAVNTLQELVGSLLQPRALLLLVPAGKAVDTVIEELTPLLEPGDCIIDAGNSYFKDTSHRALALQKKQIAFIGMGISGGQDGARYGASLMPGGPKEAYERIRPIMEACSAKVDNIPCVAYLGPGSCGHYVKMVHNGIEYGIMQLISETYDVMKRGLLLSNKQIHEVYQQWNSSITASYLLEITADIFTKIDKVTNKPLIDIILDVAEQKGTGMWTSQSAMELNVPTPTIDSAVMQRNMSMKEGLRGELKGIYSDKIEWKDSASMLQNAFLCAFILTYEQGFSLLRAASKAFHYGLDLETIATIWRGGCIIRSSFLDTIRKAYQKNPGLSTLMLDPDIANMVKAHEQALRTFVTQGAASGLPLPAFMSTLGYFDSLRSAWLPSNLIQAERDYFGAHTYERTDTKGTFHSDWEKGEVI